VILMLMALGKILKIALILFLLTRLLNIGGNIQWHESYFGPHMRRHVTCPSCGANLAKQKGFDRELREWTCHRCLKKLESPLLTRDERNYNDEYILCWPF